MLITIAGASGSGKSYIADYLAHLNENIVHLNIDLVGHEVLEKTKRLVKIIYDKSIVSG